MSKLVLRCTLVDGGCGDGCGCGCGGRVRSGRSGERGGEANMPSGRGRGPRRIIFSRV